MVRQGDVKDASSRPSAARMYQAAEALVDTGHYADAVRMMRHAVLSLPKNAENDEMRHQLIVRMAYLQLMASEASGDPAYARDAATMLEAYGQRHLALFGDDRNHEREDVYEMLFTAETLAEELEASPAPKDQGTRVASAETAAQEPVIDTHAGEELEPEFSRDVRVKRGWFYDPDDPKVMARLKSPMSDAFNGLMLTRGGDAVLSEPRPMVRRRGRVERVGPPPPEDRDVGKLARAVLKASRPGLRECYRGAAARSGELQTEATIELEVHDDGSLHDVRVVEGDVGDGLGDACVIEHLAQTKVAQRTATRMRIPLLFFYDGPQTMYEWGREDLRKRPRNYDIGSFGDPPE